MSTLTVNGSAVKKMTIKDSSGTEQKVKKWYHDGVKVFSSGNICTYYVNTNDVHSEEIDGDDSCLTPKTFTPSISGWTFVGWREDNVVSSTVLTSKTMGEDPITLYAVFKKVSYVAGVYVTQWYNNGNWINPCIYVGTSSGTVVEYFNNGASIIPPKTFTPSISGWTFVGWRGDTTATSSVYGSYTMGTGIVTLYGVFRRTLTASFNGNGATSGSVSSISGIQYYNNGNYNSPTIKLPGNGFAKTDYVFTGWNYGAVGASVTLTSNITVYAQWRQSIVRIVQNSALCSGVSMVVGQVDRSDMYDWSTSGPSITLGSNAEEEWEQHAYLYFNVKVPAGKKVYATVRGQNLGSYIHLWESSFFMWRLINPATGVHETRRDILGGSKDFTNGGDTSITKDDVSVSVTSVALDAASYIGFTMNNGTYGGSGRIMRFTVVDLYYYV